MISFIVTLLSFVEIPYGAIIVYVAHDFLDYPQGGDDFTKWPKGSRIVDLLEWGPFTSDPLTDAAFKSLSLENRCTFLRVTLDRCVQEAFLPTIQKK